MMSMNRMLYSNKRLTVLLLFADVVWPVLIAEKRRGKLKSACKSKRLQATGTLMAFKCLTHALKILIGLVLSLREKEVRRALTCWEAATGAQRAIRPLEHPRE